MRVWRTRKRNAVADRQALVAIVTDWTSPQKHVLRAQIVKHSRATGCI
jgi:hypothetical protein